MNYYNELKQMQVTMYNPIIEDTAIICLYGAGSLGQLAMDCMGLADIKVRHIFDREKQGSINGIEIETIEKLSKEESKNILLLITICTIPYETIVKDLKDFKFKQIMPFYTYAYLKFSYILSNGWYIEDITNYFTEICEVSELLMHDECSLHHYMSFVWWKCTGREVIYSEYPILSKRKYFASPIMPNLGIQESYLDCGSHYGDTIKQFLDTVHGKYKSIMAFEPDRNSLEIAKKRFQEEKIIWDSRGVFNKSTQVQFQSGMGFASKLNDSGQQKIETVSIDELNISPSIIKIHVEGAEYAVLEGAYRTIVKNRPIIMVFADHSIDGLYKIPSLVTRYEDYLLYFNYCDYCGNTAIFYMIPKERAIGKNSN